MLVSKQIFSASQGFILDTNGHIAKAVHQSCLLFDLGIFFQQCRANGGVGSGTVVDEFALLKTVTGNPENVILFFVKSVVTQFVNDELQDERACCDAQCKAEHLY